MSYFVLFWPTAHEHYTMSGESAPALPIDALSNILGGRAMQKAELIRYMICGYLPALFFESELTELLLRVRAD